MPTWHNQRTIDRMTDVLHPARKKKMDDPLGDIIAAVVPKSPKKGKKKNASAKSKRRVQMRKSGKNV